MLGDTFYIATKSLWPPSIHIFHNHIHIFLITQLTFLKYRHSKECTHYSYIQEQPQKTVTVTVTFWTHRLVLRLFITVFDRVINFWTHISLLQFLIKCYCLRPSQQTPQICIDCLVPLMSTDKLKKSKIFYLQLFTEPNSNVEQLNFSCFGGLFPTFNFVKK